MNLLPPIIALQSTFIMGAFGMNWTWREIVSFLQKNGVKLTWERKEDERLAGIHFKEIMKLTGEENEHKFLKDLDTYVANSRKSNKHIQVK